METVRPPHGTDGRPPADMRMHGRPTMALEWFTYATLGERLGISPEAVRQRAIRHEWTKRTGNDGRAEVRVDVEELIAAQPPAPSPKLPSDDRPTPDRESVVHPADDRAVDALVASLREMVDRADAQAERERERAADERMRADAERARADRERDRADALVADLTRLQSEAGITVASLDRDVAQLRAVIDEMRRPTAPAAPVWWRWIGAGRVGRAS